MWSLKAQIQIWTEFAAADGREAACGGEFCPNSSHLIDNIKYAGKAKLLLGRGTARNVASFPM
jgi:hypothetical protein